MGARFRRHCRLLGFLVFVCAPAGATTPATPFAEYRFDEGSFSGTPGEVVDSSGNARNGSRVASPPQPAVVQTIDAGKVCRAIDVPDNGGNAQVDAVDTTVSPVSVGPLGSITFWW